ncbi:preprotein translocase subunit SecE [Syntrophomonas erecta]
MSKNSVPAKKDDGITLKDRWENTKEYFRGVYSELKKVHWPDRRQLIGYTGVVLFSVALMALIIWLFDSGLSFLLNQIFKAFA